MALKKLSFQVQPGDAGKRLDQFLAEKLPEGLGQPVSKGKARKLVVAGAVYLNGKRVRIASKELLPRARVDAFVDPIKFQSDFAAQERQAAPFDFRPADILFEDEYLIAVNKPPGLPTQPTLDEARDNLFAAVKRFLVRRDGQKDPYVGLHHRLDRDTSGVVLLTKAQAANSGISEIFASHFAVKTYLAVCARPLPDVADSDRPREWTIKNYLARANDSGKRARYTAVRSGGDFAHTDFRLLEIMPRALLIEAKPKTGRTHQIRVHLSEYGMPILGDPVYNRRPREVVFESIPRTLLHAANLTFPHPISKVEISISAPIPEDFVNCLKKLGHV
ncbi:MAG: RluA family pseudouridine synthase [Oligoflexia bacterium]|nr:RluA family pseudouridine synthase [Oligoflexia bacterium]